MIMKVSEAVVKILEKEGITHAFGIPGAGINGLYKYMATSSIKHYCHRHEENCVHAAGGFYRASGKMALALCTSGPGATNFITGIYTCNIDSIPVICITGQGNTNQIGTDAFQCVPTAEIAKPIAKKTYCLMNKDQVVETFREGFRIAREGKPGPVVFDFPLDVQNADIDFDIDSYVPYEVKKPVAEEYDIKKAVEMIKEAKKPIILMGGGVIESGANKELVKLAEMLKVPVITTYMAKGGIPINHPLNAGHCGIQVGQPIGNYVFLQSDLVLGIGCRFTDRHTGNIKVYTEGRKFIHINICPSEINKIFKADLGIVSDAKPAIEMLIKEVEKQKVVKDWDLVKTLPEKKKELARKVDHKAMPINPHRVFHELNEYFGDNAIFTTGCGITQIWSGQLQEVDSPRHYIPSGGAGCLGYDIPAAFGASVATGMQGVAVMGDFGFTFHAEELAVCAKNHVPVIVVIVNNAYLGLIRQNQKFAYGYEYAVEMSENQNGMIDYVKLGEGLGCYAERVFDPDEIKNALRRAQENGKKNGQPAVIDIICEPQAHCSMGGALNAIKEFNTEEL